ncbi:MAG TPA: nucleotidyltransferase family protein [Candidatus Acidoferrales bacterium]|nr:nucleotidyltransferase family protein [Candidatus Acidoferrales bacterium]
MPSTALKLAAISALRSQPDFSGIRSLNRCSDREMRGFLRWLDHSGLTLHFLASLRDAGQIANLRTDIRAALERRLQANSTRMQALLEDCRSVNAAFQTNRIPHAFLKGFTLIPEFCPEVALRHHSDVDILIAPEFLPAASAVLVACGYQAQAGSEPSEYVFTTPMLRIPTLRDDIYELPPQRQIELHTSIWNAVGQVSLIVPMDVLSRAESREYFGIISSRLSLEDRFLIQVLHAFGHLLGSWLRLSWLWEIHYFVSTRIHEDALWQSFRARAGRGARMQNAIGLVLGLTREIFSTTLPDSLHESFVEPLPETIQSWIKHCGVQWALADISGSKLTLLIHREFIGDANTWRKYLLRRIVPVSAKTSPGGVEASDWKTRILNLFAKLEFAGARILFHAREGLRLGWESLRWRRILHSNRRNHAASS